LLVAPIREISGQAFRQIKEECGFSEPDLADSPGYAGQEMSKSVCAAVCETGFAEAGK
jgi:hypothetical protein